MLPVLAALLVFVATSVAAALAMLLPAHRGLDTPYAASALVLGAVFGLVAGWHTARQEKLMPLGRRRLSPWGWIMLTVFALFALRSFGWLVFQDGAKLAVGSPNNLGDLSMHLQEVRFFADGAPWWPVHPEAANHSLRYYPGINLFHALLSCVGLDDLRVFVWMGLVGSAATALALYRWGGSFTLAGFLFSGGLAGWQVFKHGFADYQADLGWKSLPLAIFVTQRPFLYALPAGLLLMIHWRRKFFTDLPPAAKRGAPNSPPPPPPGVGPGLLPFWVEAVLYATLPVLHLFAFLFLSALLGWWFLAYFWRPAVRWHLAALVAIAAVPATYQVALMTQNFATEAGATLTHVQWGWMAHKLPPLPFLWFWPLNFGLFLVLAPALWTQLVCWGAQDWWRAHVDREQPPALRSREADAATAFVIPAGLIFLVTLNVMFARWDWDNTKLMLWCYLAFLPFLWRLWVRPLTWVLRVPLCIVLFLSGAVCLIGGLAPHASTDASGYPKKGIGYPLVDRKELDGAFHVVTSLPVRARYACAPDYNHPLVFCGRTLAMGYEGHLYSQNLDYKALLGQLNSLMLGEPGWEQTAAKLGVRYVYWGPREARRWPASTRPWEDRPPLAAGGWGSIYEVGR